MSAAIPLVLPPFADNVALVKNSSDNSKLAIFSASSITTATTRTITLPDNSGTLAETNLAQSFTAVQTFTASPTAPFGSSSGCERFGAGAGNNAATSFNNTAFGLSVLAALAAGQSNTGVGAGCLSSTTNGNNNSALGTNALAANTTGSSCTAVGFNSLASNTVGTNLTALGGMTLNANTGGVFSTALGAGCLQNITGGTGNTAVGNQSLQPLTSGDHNTAVGNSTFFTMTAGSHNTVIGSQCFYFMTSGSNNVMVGWSTSGGACTTGSGNTLLGTDTDTTAAGTANGVALGYQAVCASNECAFGPNLNVQTGQVSSSTSTLRPRADFTDSNVDNTDATRKYRRVCNVYDTAQREAWRVEASGSAAKIGFLGTAAAVQQVCGATLTNNVTSGGSANVIADFTNLTVYATDAATIRNDIYQLAASLKVIQDALRVYGLLS